MQRSRILIAVSYDLSIVAGGSIPRRPGSLPGALRSGIMAKRCPDTCVCLIRLCNFCGIQRQRILACHRAAAGHLLQGEEAAHTCQNICSTAVEKLYIVNIHIRCPIILAEAKNQVKELLSYLYLIGYLCPTLHHCGLQDRREIGDLSIGAIGIKFTGLILIPDVALYRKLHRIGAGSLSAQKQANRHIVIRNVILIHVKGAGIREASLRDLNIICLVRLGGKDRTVNIPSPFCAGI